MCLPKTFHTNQRDNQCCRQQKAPTCIVVANGNPGSKKKGEKIRKNIHCTVNRVLRSEKFVTMAAHGQLSRPELLFVKIYGYCRF